MRAGWFISLIGHIGIGLMVLHTWQTAVRPAEAANSLIVPVEIVAVGPESVVRSVAPPTPGPDQFSAPASAEPENNSVSANPRPRPRTSTLNDLLNRASGQPSPRPTPATSQSNTNEPPRQGNTLSGAEVTSLKDRIQSLADAHIRRNRCWQGVDDQPDPGRLVVVVSLTLNRNGALRGQPQVLQPRNTTFDPSMRVAVDRALRAIRRCDPFPFGDDPIVGPHFELWGDLQYTFRTNLQ